MHHVIEKERHKKKLSEETYNNLKRHFPDLDQFDGGWLPLCHLWKLRSGQDVLGYKNKDKDEKKEKDKDKKTERGKEHKDGEKEKNKEKRKKKRKWKRRRERYRPSSVAGEETGRANGRL